MSIFTPIWSPKTQEGLQIAEFKPDEIFGLVGDKPHVFDPHYFKVRDKDHEVNLGAPRYHVLKKNRSCVCCGVIGTKMFLDLDEQTTEKDGVPRYHFNLYAETYDTLRCQTHYVLMTRDHIVPRSQGGAEDMSNYQTMCFNCNCLKDVTSMTLDQMQRALFPAYRAYRSSLVIRQVKELTEPYHKKIEGNRRAIEHITAMLGKIKDEKAAREKLVLLSNEIAFLTRELERVEIASQVTGVVPEKIEIRFNQH